MGRQTDTASSFPCRSFLIIGRMYQYFFLLFPVTVLNIGSNFAGCFPLQRETRQGDPLSAHLSILVMLIPLRTNDDIKVLVKKTILLSYLPTIRIR